jgi:hypothetical protein
MFALKKISNSLIRNKNMISLFRPQALLLNQKSYFVQNDGYDRRPDRREREPMICYNCKKEGHMSRNCPEPRKCNVCGEPGHFAKDCTQKREVRKDMKCFNCGENGHFSAECPRRQ